MTRWILVALLVMVSSAGNPVPDRAGAAAARADPALCNPVFAAFAQRHPTDWERITDPAIRPMIGWQRLIGCHAWVIGWADEQPNPTYTHPRVVIDVTHWDHADLFALGLPHVYDGKPVLLHEEGAVPKAAGATALPARLPATGAGGASGAAPHHTASPLRATGSNSPPGEDRRG
jgi:hypothetical protein